MRAPLRNRASAVGFITAGTALKPRQLCLTIPRVSADNLHTEPSGHRSALGARRNHVPTGLGMQLSLIRHGSSAFAVSVLTEVTGMKRGVRSSTRKLSVQILGELLRCQGQLRSVHEVIEVMAASKRAWLQLPVADPGSAIAAVVPVTEQHRNANFLKDSANGERARSCNPKPRLRCCCGAR